MVTSLDYPTMLVYDVDWILALNQGTYIAAILLKTDSSRLECDAGKSFEVAWH
jgi:hypothetical protein